MTPVTSTDIDDFSPSSFANLVPRPSFKLRPATVLDSRNWLRALREAGLQLHEQEALRTVALDGLRNLWSPEDFEVHAGRLRAIWAALDQNIPVSEPDRQAHDELMGRLVRAWPALRRMTADNLEFVEDAPKLALSLYLVGWSGFDLPFRMEGGRVTLELIYELAEALRQVEQTAVANKVEGITPGLAFLELANEAFRRLNLTPAEAESFTSPSSPISDPSGSKASTGKSSSTAEPTEAAPRRSRSSRQSTSTQSPSTSDAATRRPAASAAGPTAAR